MARPRLVQAPLSFRPKACLITGRADGDIVDFGIDIDLLDPHLYIRRSEVEKAGKVCGMLSETEAASLQSEREELIAENAQLRSELKTSNLHHTADAAQMAYAGASAAAATIMQFNPDVEVPNEAIIAAVEELVEPSKEEITNANL